MANFDPNNWYRLYVNDNPKQKLCGTNLWNKGRTGATFFNATDRPRSKWQIFAMDPTTYVLRTQEGGPTALLGAKSSSEVGEETEEPGNTVPNMVKDNISDNSVFWTFHPWGDGTFYMTNAQNGTAWRMQKRPNGLLAMSSNTTGPKPEQRWSFEAVDDGQINQAKYSTVGVEFALASTTPPTGSPTASPNLPPGTTPPDNAPTDGSNAPKTSSGLSTGAKAGIGAGVGGAGTIALVLIGLTLWRRRRRRDENQATKSYQVQEMAHEGHTVKYEMWHNGNFKNEMPVQQDPIELPETTANSRAR